MEHIEFDLPRKKDRLAPAVNKITKSILPSTAIDILHAYNRVIQKHCTYPNYNVIPNLLERRGQSTIFDLRLRCVNHAKTDCIKWNMPNLRNVTPNLMSNHTPYETMILSYTFSLSLRKTRHYKVHKASNILLLMSHRQLGGMYAMSLDLKRIGIGSKCLRINSTKVVLQDGKWDWCYSMLHGPSVLLWSGCLGWHYLT